MIRRLVTGCFLIVGIALLSKNFSMSVLQVLENLLTVIEPVIISIFGQSVYKYILVMALAVCVSLYMKPFSAAGFVAIISSVMVSILLCTRTYINLLIEFGDSYHYEAMIEGGELGELGSEALPWFFQIFTSMPPIEFLNIILLLVLMLLAITLFMQVFKK